MNLDFDKAVSFYRKIANNTTLKGNVICFVSTWEKSYLDQNILNLEDLPFIQKQSSLFETILSISSLPHCPSYNETEFYLYTDREEEQDLDQREKLMTDDLKDTSESLRQLKQNFFKNQEEVEAFEKEVKKAQSILGDIHILPASQKKVIPEDSRTCKVHRVKILYFQYENLLKGLISNILRLSEKNMVYNDQVFKNIIHYLSQDVKTLTKGNICNIIEQLKDNTLTQTELDQLNTRGLNQPLQINCPSWWQKDNQTSKNKKKIKDTIDVHIFYSFESLLFFELNKSLKQINRCQNCWKIIDKQFKKAKNCPKGTLCWRERDRKKHKKNYHKNDLNLR